jgi:hypothetical protein
MAKKKDALKRLMISLDKKPMLIGEIRTVLKIDRKTEFRVTREAVERRWAEKDSEGRIRITPLGRSIPFNIISLSYTSQQIICYIQSETFSSIILRNSLL